jgi:mannose-1-phosphate guanylyltransferase
MNIILLSGGSGKRLWPLSNEIRSKQFLKLIKDDNNEPESMVQRVFRQIKAAGIDANIIVATGKNQIDSIKSQLGNNVDIVLEPERRDTFPAIALASSHLAMLRKMPPGEVVLVLPVDPYAELSYFTTLIRMEQIVKSGIANIALMGIKPTYPSAKYGYIIPKHTVNTNDLNCSLVERFQEKPTEEYAAQLINEGAMWNGGVFAFKLGYLMEIIEKYIKYCTYEDVERQYSSFPKISFDYEVVEKEQSIAMVEYSGTWKDLGTWNTLTEVMNDIAIGKVIMADSCVNTHVVNELDIPITVLGAKNMIIAASPDGILVSDKHQSSFLKPFVDSIEQRPMYEERRWGEYKVLDYATYGDGTLSLTKHMLIRAGEMISYQLHSIRDEIWTIVDGKGDLLLDGHIRNVKRGDVAYITKGMKHAIKAITDLHFVEVQIGIELSEKDIERFEWKW